jgi:hypothetical protein
MKHLNVMYRIRVYGMLQLARSHEPAAPNNLFLVNGCIFVACDGR